MLHSQVLIFGYQLAQAAGVRESMSCASRDSGFAELCERFAGSQATEFMEQLGNLGINSNIGLIVTSVFWLEQMKNRKWISVDTFCKAVAMQDMLRRADGRDWGNRCAISTYLMLRVWRPRKKGLELMTRKMNRRQNASSSRKHSSALTRFCFNASYLVPAVFIHFLLSRLFFAYHESELNISPTFLRAAAQLKCECLIQGRAKSHLTLLAYVLQELIS